MFLSLCFTVGVGDLGQWPTGNLCETASAVSAVSAVCCRARPGGAQSGLALVCIRPFPGRAYWPTERLSALLGQTQVLLAGQLLVPGMLHPPSNPDRITPPVPPDTVGAAPLSTFQEERNEFKRSQRICVYSCQAHQKRLRVRYLHTVRESDSYTANYLPFDQEGECLWCCKDH